MGGAHPGSRRFKLRVMHPASPQRPALSSYWVHAVASARWQNIPRLATQDSGLHQSIPVCSKRNSIDVLSVRATSRQSRFSWAPIKA